MFDLTYTLREHGWATIRASFDETQLDFEVSYMSDALEDFVSSVVAVATGQAVARFALIDEPGEHCWTIRPDGDFCKIQIVHLKGMWTTKHYNYNSKTRTNQQPPEEQGVHVASFTCRMADLIAAIDRMLENIEHRYTAAEFARTRNPGVSAATAARLRQLRGRQPQHLSPPP